MSSGYSSCFRRYILYHIPGLFKKCPEGNYHWFWHRFCICCDGDGGYLYSFKMKKFSRLSRKWETKNANKGEKNNGKRNF